LNKVAAPFFCHSDSSSQVDRLITELQLTPLEAFQHLRRVLERVNAVASTLLLSEIRFNEESTPGGETKQDLSPEDEENNPLIQIWNFEPEKGNVIFCSAFDCWGFSINRFAFYWAKKLSINKGILQKHLFDDFGYNQTTKKIIKIDPYNPQTKPMFVTMVLEPIWQMYDVIFNQQNTEKAAKMAKRAVCLVIHSYSCVLICLGSLVLRFHSEILLRELVIHGIPFARSWVAGFPWLMQFCEWLCVGFRVLSKLNTISCNICFLSLLMKVPKTRLITLI
jgi:hypothetical protein